MAFWGQYRQNKEPGLPTRVGAGGGRGNRQISNLKAESLSNAWLRMCKRSRNERKAGENSACAMRESPMPAADSRVAAIMAPITALEILATVTAIIIPMTFGCQPVVKPQSRNRELAPMYASREEEPTAVSVRSDFAYTPPPVRGTFAPPDTTTEPVLMELGIKATQLDRSGEWAIAIEELANRLADMSFICLCADDSVSDEFYYKARACECIHGEKETGASAKEHSNRWVVGLAQIRNKRFREITIGCKCSYADGRTRPCTC